MEDHNKQTEENGRGRPTKYDAALAEQAHDLCLLGYTDKMLASYFEVHEDTIYEWKKTHPQFSEAVRRGKLGTDIEVVKSLHKRAVGFTYEEVTYEKLLSNVDGVPEDENDIKSEVYKKKVATKMVVPDVGAQMNWLKNRQRELWREKVEIESTNTNLNSELLTPEQMKAIKQAWDDQY